MANEIQVSSNLSYTNPAKGIVTKTLSIINALFSITGFNYTLNSFTVPTTAGGTAIPIGNLGSLGWAIIVNRDSSNYVTLLNAVSGTPFIRLMPGEAFSGRFDPTVTAPAALAHTTTVEIEYLILEN